MIEKCLMCIQVTVQVIEKCLMCIQVTVQVIDKCLICIQTMNPTDTKSIILREGIPLVSFPHLTMFINND